MHLKNVSLMLLVALVLFSNSALAQDQGGLLPQPGAPSIPFNLIPPGARALAMGGAFIAIADDATAAEANPAGLTILTRPEISVHGRSSSFDIALSDLNADFAIEFVAASRQVLLDFPVRGIGPFTRPSNVVRWDESVTDASFASFVYPFKRVVFSVYFLQTNSFQGASAFRIVDEGFTDFYTTTTAIESSLESLGASIAFKIGKSVSIGLSLRSSRFVLDSSEVFRIDYFRDLEGPFIRTPAGEIAVNPNPNLNLTDFLLFRDRRDDDDNDITYNAGILFNPNGKFSVGLVYKESGEFEINGVRDFIDCIDLAGPDRDCRSGNTAQLFETSGALSPAPIEPPDFLGLGLAARPTDRLTLAVDIDRITYSNLEIPPSLRVAGIHEDIEDATEIHVGLEYTWLTKGTSPISLRAGLWNEPDHDGFATVDSEQTHATIGLGFVLKKLQVDLAGHFSDTVDEGIVSLVYRF